MPKLQDSREFPDGGAFSTLNLFALLPCPLKVPLEKEIKNCIRCSEAEYGALTYLLESHANNQLSFYPYVEQFENIDEIPDIVITPGINSFLHKRFIDKFIAPGFFIDVADYKSNDALRGLGIKDPGGNYTMLCMNTLVMVADLTRMGQMTLPEKWEDLLQPEYENKVVIRGQKGSFCETTLLTIYKAYGMAGIIQLAKAVKDGWHPSQMVKMAGSGNPQAPFISVMPYFFAKTIKNKENVKIIWPKEGAIVSPVTMLVKSSQALKLRELTAFLTGPEVGRICAGAFFPVVHPEVENKLPPEASFNWLGWDFIKSEDMGALKKDLDKNFLKSLLA